ncbi:MAG: bifunctional adenosylcobinamide kinase/adenosylcobinamide-phosphate guanylyltransferase [Lachnospiraceae bacterium]|nr:bifunctional adenosylcobinamide kinase/adenosylcobinamide-phosphate guanylyltransferase [Lachnospiraceae bacterium]
MSLILILGGASSGKSEYAEGCLLALDREIRYYIATMKVHDAEDDKRVKRHIKLREGKDFITIEKTKDIGAIELEDHKGVAILEDMANLLANEMFDDPSFIPDPERIADKIVSDIEGLLSKLDSLVIVSDNIFDSGTDYDQYTISYMKAMGEINKKLSNIADRVVEVVAGIPIVHKG